MASYSDPIAVAAATATVYDLPSPRSTVRLAVIFYDDVAATPEDIVSGSGTRDIAVSAVVPLEGYGVTTLPIVGASAEDVPEGSWKVFELGVPTGRISVACAQGTDPATATHYRIFFDA